MGIHSPKRVSISNEMKIRLIRGFRSLVSNKFGFVISLLFPFLAAAITVWIAGKDMFENMESTKSACFVLVCAAIWGGLFNSIQIIVKDRKIIKREYDCGALRLGCQVAASAVIQFVLCAFQSAILCLSFYGVHLVYGNELPSKGLILESVTLEYYITLFLILFAADALGLCISCLVKDAQVASQMSPYILIVQLIFSGVLFSLDGVTSTISTFMVSRWGMAALGSTSNLNELPLRLQAELPMLVHEADEAFLHTGEHLWKVWLILVVFALVPLVIGYVALHSVKKHTRS